MSVLAQNAEEVLAKIGNQTVTIGDLNPQAQAAFADLPKQIAETRKKVLEREIARRLFELEAAARKITVEQLLETAVKKQIINPPAEQVKAVYEANRNVFGDQTLDQARPTIEKYLRRQQEEQLANTFAASLMTKHAVKFGVDVNSPSLKPTDVVATIGANKITAEQFNEQMKPHEYYLRAEVYQKLKSALDDALYSHLILKEAERNNLPPEEIIKREITDKFKEPTEAEAQKFYDERKANFGGDSFENLKTQILSYLSDERRAALERNLFERLMKQNAVTILLKEPTAPVLNISTANAPSKGNKNAPVTVVMFSDFQCSACARTHPILSEILKSVGNNARLVVRNYPLTEIHENAFRAAQAAAAANAQGKFFEYIELLYQNQNALDDASLKKYAVQVGLNAKQFEADLASGKFDAVIRQDMKDGEFYGIRGTPTIYVNGKIVGDLSPETLKKAIENALSKK